MATQDQVIASMPVTTGLEFPGWTVKRYVGPCFGLIVRSMGAIKAGTTGLVILVVLVAVAVVGWLQLRRHGEGPVPASHWQPTTEVFRDPSSARSFRHVP